VAVCPTRPPISPALGARRARNHGKLPSDGDELAVGEQRQRVIDATDCRSVGDRPGAGDRIENLGLSEHAAWNVAAAREKDATIRHPRSSVVIAAHGERRRDYPRRVDRDLLAVSVGADPNRRGPRMKLRHDTSAASCDCNRSRHAHSYDARVVDDFDSIGDFTRNTAIERPRGQRTACIREPLANMNPVFGTVLQEQPMRLATLPRIDDRSPPLLTLTNGVVLSYPDDAGGLGARLESEDDLTACRPR
jgi:hypothetical protein